MLKKALNTLIAYKYSLITLLIGASYFTLLVLVHDITLGDYAFFSTYPFEWQYGIDRWFDWSSRFFIESAVNLFSKSLLAWSIVTVLMGSVLFWSIGRLLGNRRIYQSIVLFSLLLLTNFYLLTSAGIFATTVNYLWPMASFLFTVALFLVPFRNRILQKVSVVISVPLFIFAMCSEQLAILAVLLTLLYIGFRKYKKIPIPKMAWMYLGIAIIGVLSVILSPGNAVRSTLETANWWPGFGEIPLHEKIVTGIVVTFSRLILAPEILAVVLLFSILVLAIRRQNIQAFTAILPAIVLCLLFFFPANGGGPTTYIRFVNFFNELREKSVYLNAENFATPGTIKMYLLSAVVIGLSTVVSLLFLYKRQIKTLIILSTLGSGLIVSLAVSLSPTIYASSTRTLYIFTIILLFNVAYIVQDIIHDVFLEKKARAVKSKTKG